MPKHSAEEYKKGQVLLIDKPLTWTSFQAVKKLKYVLIKNLDLPKRFKIGHAGTLDPLATGLLILCTGKFTKRISEFQAQKKEYTGTIILGATTPSYDLETEVNKTFPTEHINLELIEKVKQTFLGKTEQYPPVYSAIKKEGKRLYEHARAGEEVKIESRTIEVFEFEITRVELPELDFRIVCGKGTYIRSIANDLGHKLNSGAYLSKLRRTKIGDFSVADAISPQKFEEIFNKNDE